MSDVVQIVKQELQNALDIKDVQGDIKVLNQEMIGLREQQKAHSIENKQGQADIREDIKQISAQINTWKGSIGVLIMISGAVGAGLSKAVAFFFTIKP